MKKIQIFAASVFVLAFATVFNTAKAQISSDNTIKEVQLNKNDAFNEIRKASRLPALNARVISCR